MKDSFQLPPVNRRSFLKQSGQLLIGFSLFPMVMCSPDNKDGDQTKVEEQPGRAGADDIDSWIRLRENGTVTVITGKQELGQGIRTALMQMAAEELDVRMDRVSIITADTRQTPDERYTAGSRSIESSGRAIRQAAAEARMRLLQLAEEKLNVKADQLVVRDGVVQAKGNSQQSISYWELLSGKKISGKISGNAPLKNPADYQLVGQPLPRQEIIQMATGGEVFVHNMRLPGMVHARVLRPPGYGATLQAIPEQRVSKMPGVLRVVRNGSFAAVIASKEYQAIQALEALKAEATWESGPALPPQEELFQAMQKVREGQAVEESDSIQDTLQTAALQHEATYTRPYHMHASMGPSCALALWEENRLTIWTHSQGVYPLRNSIADMLQLDKEQIDVIGVPGAGCYGHNGADDVAADAALLARSLSGYPVRVQWMREDEHSWEPYGSAMVLQLRAGLDKQGKIVGWDTQIWSDSHSTRPGGEAGHLLAAQYLEDPFEKPSGGYSGGNHRNASPLYDFPDVRIVSHPFTGPLRTSALRALGAYANIFALESFMDEMAVLAKQDPLTFRMKHLRDERGQAVLEAAAKGIGWDMRSKTDHGLGIAFAQYKNEAAYFAVAAEVAYDRKAQELQLIRLVGAIDAGQTINPDGLKNQTEGGMIQSASWTLLEQVTYDNSRVTSRNWDTYPILRFRQVPEVEVLVLDRPELPPLGAGETAQGPTAAAIANAIYRATGKRMRDLPITPDKILNNKS
ncbi:molybdopterin cofactor-binding domain-containing protein [uncultured Pontibacter sp.]|uniref:xanthine dehydrogenase family protein molybdopterin-binding subunit n=1 Tax=uncultured Pontibacter sp. TaxID=453356 RepID=UPI002605332F|nr:molybdopterin cofactor-binding domain-containing protein [uncultured Pontibacter sp.]